MIVVDASVIVTALSDAPTPINLIIALREAQLAAPYLIDYEIISALRGRTLAGKLTESDAYAVADRYAALRIDRHDAVAYLGRFLDLRHNFTAYDASYVALAQALNVPLVTADSKMLEAENLGVEVRLIA